MSYKYDSHYLQVNWCYMYSRLPIIQTFKGNRKKFELSGVKVINKKGNENCFKLVGGLSYRGFELLGVNCINKHLFKCSDIN